MSGFFTCGRDETTRKNEAVTTRGCESKSRRGRPWGWPCEARPAMLRRALQGAAVSAGRTVST
jgi:hypothetical protein